MSDEEREQRDTLPPESEPCAEDLQLFETLVRDRGENDARLLQLEALLFGYEHRSSRD